MSASSPVISPELQFSLRQRFNPDGSPLRKHQILMLGMLKKIDAVCRENNIRYWLSSGTCIGALRHGGFIPWDDDVDIEMMESDFKKLRRAMLAYRGNDLIWQDASTDPEYVQPFAKIRDTRTQISELENADRNYRFRGVFIDVFVLRPSSSVKLYKFGEKFQQWFFYKPQRISHGFVRRIILNLSRILVTHGVYPVLNLLGNINSRGQYRHRLGTAYYKPRFKADIESVRFVRFEDTEFPIPVNAEHYLESIYGDFMSLPDIDSIVPHITEIKYL